MSEKLVANSRWARSRKLLPGLKLKYPSDIEMREISRFANVDSTSIFNDHIRSIVLDAYLSDRLHGKLSTPAVKKKLSDVAKKAHQLRQALKAIDIGSPSSGEYAGSLLEYEISRFRSGEELVLIPEYVTLLEALKEAAHRAAQLESKRGPKGAGGNPAFDRFIEALFTAAWQRWGNWTNYKKADGTWTGSLLQALKILQPCLPTDFFPRGELGRSIEHIKKKFKDYITKNQSVSA